MQRALILLIAIFVAYGTTYIVAPVALLITLIVLFVFLSGWKRG